MKKLNAVKRDQNIAQHTKKRRNFVNYHKEHKNTIYKCGTAAIQDVKDHIKEALRQLGNKGYYKTLHSDPTETHKNY